MVLTRKDSEVSPLSEQMVVSGTPLYEADIAAATWERIDREVGHAILGLPGEEFGGPMAWWRWA